MKSYVLTDAETRAFETEDGRKATRAIAQQTADEHGGTCEIVSADGIVLDVAYPTKPVREN